MPPLLPTGTRLYRSVLDDFGVSYAPLGAGYRFIDLVGRAYRRAGAQLLGLPGAALSPPYLALCEEDRRNLEGLAAALKNGGGAGATAPAVAAAIKPLQVYREEMKRQQVLGRDKTEAEVSVDQVVQGFRAGLVELGITG